MKKIAFIAAISAMAIMGAGCSVIQPNKSKYPKTMSGAAATQVSPAPAEQPTVAPGPESQATDSAAANPNVAMLTMNTRLARDLGGQWSIVMVNGVTIDRDKTSINLNENMDSLVPASKISDMPTGWICGQTARDFVQTKTGSGGSMNIQESEEFKTSKFYCKTDFDMNEIKKEEAGYVPLPKFYTFKSRDERERILYKNFVQVGEDVKEMIQEIQKYKVK